MSHNEKDTPVFPGFEAARNYFPRGLFQPEGSFRFSSDALLLACFLKPASKETRLLDLGTGCGVVALAVQCACPGICAVGIDKEAPLIDAARRNAALLGFSDCFSALRADLGAPELFRRGAAGKDVPDCFQPQDVFALPLPEHSFHLVLANPPFREPGKGRLPTNPVRKSALFEDGNTLEEFCGCAARALVPGGRFGILHTPERQKLLCGLLAAKGLAPVRILPVQTLPGKAPQRILVEAVKVPPGEPRPGLHLEQPLALRERTAPGTCLTREALAFCPYLRCSGR